MSKEWYLRECYIIICYILVVYIATSTFILSPDAYVKIRLRLLVAYGNGLIVKVPYIMYHFLLPCQLWNNLQLLDSCILFMRLRTEKLSASLATVVSAVNVQASQNLDTGRTKGSQTRWRTQSQLITFGQLHTVYAIQN
ncbi:hypothetical protein QQ045_028473 [Rhodiola kirilowii]